MVSQAVKLIGDRMNNTVKRCKIEGCNNPGRKSKLKSSTQYFTRGFCSVHYQRYLKHGDPSIVLKAPIPTNRTHGKWHMPEYKAWINMKNRCYSKRNRHYLDYGGRGIFVCDGWLDSLDSFLIDMGERPTAKHSLDRVDNDSGYTCGHCEHCVAKSWEKNCKWSTQKEQINNRRPLASKNGTGCKFVYKNKGFTYKVSKMVDGKLKHFGNFSSFEKAVEFSKTIY